MGRYSYLMNNFCDMGFKIEILALFNVNGTVYALAEVIKTVRAKKTGWKRGR